MLCLSRNTDESIIVQCGTEIIRIVLVEIRGSKARIGVEAERTVQIDREEVYLAKQREKNGGSA